MRFAAWIGKLPRWVQHIKKIEEELEGNNGWTWMAKVGHGQTLVKFVWGFWERN